MEKDYSIDEILSAISDIQKIKKEKKIQFSPVKSSKVDTTDIPKNTLKLIEEAEKFIG